MEAAVSEAKAYFELFPPGRRILKRVFSSAFEDDTDLRKKRRLGEPHGVKRAREELDEEDLRDLEEPETKSARRREELLDEEESIEVVSARLSQDFMGIDVDGAEEDSDNQSRGDHGEDSQNKLVFMKVIKWLLKIEERNRPRRLKALINVINILGKTQIVFDPEAFYHLLIINEVIKEIRLGQETYVDVNTEFDFDSLQLEQFNLSEMNLGGDETLIREVLLKLCHWCKAHTLLQPKAAHRGMTKKRLLRELGWKVIHKVEASPQVIIDTLCRYGFIAVGRDEMIEYFLEGIVSQSLL